MSIVRVTWFDDKSPEVKEQVAADITQTLVERTGVDPKWVYVLFEDVPAPHGAAGGRLFSQPSDE